MSSAQNKEIVRSKLQTIMMNVNVSLGSLNIGYVLSYLTLSIETLFANLNIQPEEKTKKLSLLTGILPLGCFVGVFIAFFLKKKLTYKQCIYVADLIGIMSLFTLIANYEVIVIFRFLLGISNGISSLIMPVYVKSLCPQQYYHQLSMLIGYGINTGLAIGQLFGIGYIDYHGSSSQWWRIVFSFPPLICLIRSSVIHFIYNYDSPEQLINKGNVQQAQYVLCEIYKTEFVEEQYTRYLRIAQIEEQNKNKSLSDCFQRQNFITLQVGIISMLVQIWCGSFSVFYYSAQIFQSLADDNRLELTVYTFSLGLSGFVAQFSTIYKVKKLGSKYILMLGSFLLGCLNLIISILSIHPSPEIDRVIFFMFILLIMTFASTLGPVAWSIVPQLNDSNSTFIVMENRWAFQTILIFSFPFIVDGIQIFGAFLIFSLINFAYFVYCYFCLIDGRGMQTDELVQLYHKKFGSIISPSECKKLEKTEPENLPVTTPNNLEDQPIIK